MAITLDEFIDSITTSGLMDTEDVQSFLATLPAQHRPQTAEDLAKEMYRLGKLTKFQAQAIYQKKTRGLVVGNYIVLDRLGKGGMGAVYKAQHKRMKRIVALKMLPSSATKSSDAVKRFQREVEAAAKLSHANIVTAYDADEAKGVHFLVMEYVEGQDLYALVKTNGPLSVARAVDYLSQAAQGLEYAHSQGVIHRDIKPHNLLLDKKGTVKILDMGLARIGEAAAGASEAAEEGLTQSGQVMGTLDYMPPEQALDTKSVDLRADIYSLGCTLYYLLAGRPPFGGDTIGKKFMAHREDPIPSLRALRNDVPEALDAVFQKMLAKRAEDRQASMAEVLAQLRDCALPGGAAPHSFPPSSASYAETVDYRSAGQVDTASHAESSPLDELFASDPAHITERLVAPSRTVGKRWTKQQKLVMAAAVAVVVLLLLGLVLKTRPSKEPLGKVAAAKETSKAKPKPEIAADRQPSAAAPSAESPAGPPETPVAHGPDKAQGFVSLFDGKTLDGWEGDRTCYSVEDGKLVADFGHKPSHGLEGALFTAKDYQDFTLRLEYTVSPAANGGIVLRAPLTDRWQQDALEVQLLDDSAPVYQHQPADKLNGSLFGVVAVKPGHLKPPGQWNRLEIQWKGRRITETLNGVIVLDTDLDDPSDKTSKGAAHPGLKREKGRILFLGHASQGRIEFRNLEIKELTPTQEIAGQDQGAEAGFVSLFDGKTLDGWHTNGVGRWNVEDGAIVGRLSKSQSWTFGHLISNAQYADFELRLKFMLHGNSGVYVRGQESGTDGAAGLQIELSSPKEIGGFIEVVAHPASVGIRVPNPQNLVSDYFRADGWNDLAVTVLGNKVTCRVNGQQTAELSDYTRRQNGAIIFQLFGVCDTEVMFKGIRVKRLP